MKISKEFKVGLFMVSALVLLYFGFNFLKGIDFFSSNNHYYAIYRNVDKLTMSNQIFLNGFAVGRVSDIYIDQNNGNEVIVELEINSDIKLTDSTTALLTGDILGNKSITLQIRKGSRVLNPNDTLLSNLDRGLTDILAESAAPVASNLQTTLGKFNYLVDDLRNTVKRVDTFMIGFKSVQYELSMTLRTTRDKLGVVAGGFDSTLVNINGTLTKLRPTLDNLQVLSDSLKRMEINATMQKLQTTLASLEYSLKQLQKGDNTASKLLTDDELYNNMNKALLSLDSLLTHFDENPKHFLAPLGKSKERIARDRRKQATKDSK